MKIANKIIIFSFYFAISILGFYYIFNYCQEILITKAPKILTKIEKSTKKIYKKAAPYITVLGIKENTINFDERAKKLRIYFKKFNSPLYDLADYIIYISDKYELDYRLIPAIAHKESALCKRAPKNSFNCWGYGIYGKNKKKFASYISAIEAVAQDLKENYINKGLASPEAVFKKYAPSSNIDWERYINLFFKQLE